MDSCPLCKTAIERTAVGDYGNRVFLNCPNCGHFGLTRTAITHFEDVAGRWAGARGLLAHTIWKAVSRQPLPRHADTPLFDKGFVEGVLESRKLPSLREQGANLVRWVGDQLRNNDPGSVVEFSNVKAGTVMGAASQLGTITVAQELLDRRILSGVRDSDRMEVGLTFSGWDYYDELEHAHSEGPIAFMAMQFNDPALDSVYRECFKPAVADCGFELRRLDEGAPAGLIDDRLRVEIRRSRFLLVDLTNDNRGAYWEAGFAEGLGKPVIFSCEESQLTKTHFDTNHHLAITWRLDSFADTAVRLKDTIRATLPTEARMSDQRA